MKYLKKCLLTMLIVAAVISCLLISASAAGKQVYGAATVDATSLNVRAEKSTESDRVTTLVKGTIVVVEEKGGEWSAVNYQGFKGFVKTEYLTDIVKRENFKATGTTTGTGIAVREGPSTSKDKIGVTGDEGTVLTVIGVNDGWYKVVFEGEEGYIRSDFLEISGNAKGATAAAVASTKGQQVVEFAMQFLGYRYVYGSESPDKGFDCSGLVYYVYSQFGYKLERPATQQFKKNGVEVEKSELKPGDLVFFKSSAGSSSIGHVGIYIGDDQFIHASTSNTGVIISSLNSSNYTARWYGAKRIITD